MEVEKMANERTEELSELVECGIEAIARREPGKALPYFDRVFQRRERFEAFVTSSTEPLGIALETARCLFHG